MVAAREPRDLGTDLFCLRPTVANIVTRRAYRPRSPALRVLDLDQ